MTKNPIVLNSANYVMNWFVCNIKDKKTMEKFNTLNVVKSDKIVVESLMRHKKRLDRYNNFEKRYKEVFDE